jgi:hypothetical protein
MVCDRWRNSFEAFFEDMGPAPQGASLDRIDNAGSYTPQNCRWATAREQQNNRSITTFVSYMGRATPLADAARAAGLTPALVKNRLLRGVPLERLFEPIRHC